MPKSSDFVFAMNTKWSSNFYENYLIHVYHLLVLKTNLSQRLSPEFWTGTAERCAKTSQLSWLCLRKLFKRFLNSSFSVHLHKEILNLNLSILWISYLILYYTSFHFIFPIITIFMSVIIVATYKFYLFSVNFMEVITKIKAFECFQHCNIQ